MLVSVERDRKMKFPFPYHPDVQNNKYLLVLKKSKFKI